MAEVRAGVPADSEIVLRGGLLEKPALICNLTVVHGRKFIHLWKGCPILNKFLTGRNVSERSLANSAIIEKLAALRNAVCRSAIEEDRCDTEEDVCPTEALGLEEIGDAERSKAKKPRSRNYLPIRMKLLSLAPFLSVEVPGAFGTPWHPLVLLEVSSTAPAMEATSENFKALFDLVALDVASGSHKREQYPRKSTFASRDKDTQALYEQTSKKGKTCVYVKKVLEKPSKRRRPYAKAYSTKVIRSDSNSGSLSTTDAGQHGHDDCLS